MKRILSLFLVLLMLLALASCSFSDTDTSTQTSTQTDTDIKTDTATDTSTSTSTSTNTYVPDYTKDTAKYNILTNEAKTTLTYLNEKLEYPTVTKYKNGKQAALSITFDDANNVDAARIITEVFSEYGDMKGTIMANVGTMKANDGPEPWKPYFETGYLDLGCHGYDHSEPTTLPESGYYHEIGEAFEYLRENFPSQRVLTYATPNAHINSPYEAYLRNWCISNRLEQGGEFAETGEDFNMYRIRATMLREDTNFRSIYSAVEASIDEERWIVHLFHDIIEDNESSSYNPTKRSTFEGYVRHLQNYYGDKLWFGSFEEVSLYVLQYDKITIDYTGISRNSLTFETHCEIENPADRVLIGMNVQLPRFVDSAVAFVNGVPQTLELDKSVKNKVYTIVKDVPSDGATVEIVFGGNTTFRNSCVHTYAFDYVVEPTKENVIGYTVNTCRKCGCIYTSSYTVYDEELEAPPPQNEEQLPGENTQ